MVFDPESFELSIRMREIRVRQGLKQAEVARRMGLDPSMTSLWERGKRLVPRAGSGAGGCARGQRGRAPWADARLTTDK